MIFAKLRKWQQRFVTKFASWTEANFLLVALPGAGKTIAALYACARWIEAAGAKPRLIVWLVPLKRLKKDVKEDAAKFGLVFRTQEFDGVLKAGTHGLVFTYSGMINAVGVLRRLTVQYEVMVIFDEPHHLSINGGWGKGATEAFAFTVRRLFMTGTPWRSDDIDMPFLADRRQADGTYAFDEIFDWPLALEEEPRCIRLLTFRAFDDACDFDKDGNEYTLDSRDRLTHEQQDRWLNGAIKGDALLGEILREANNKLRECRALKPDAAGLVVCEDIRHAQRVEKKLREVTGLRVYLIVSDEEVTEDNIDVFNKQEGVWIVSVRMVSEGINIPRLMVGVYLTNYTTELFFRQFVGRIARNQGTQFDQEAYVFMPNHWALVAYGEKIKELQAIAIKKGGTGCLPPPPGTPTTYLGDHDASEGSLIIPGGGSDHDTAAIKALMRKYGPSGMTETLAAQMLRDGMAESDFPPEPEETNKDVPVVPLEDQENTVRKRAEKKLRGWVMEANGDFADYRNRVNRAVGINSVENATLEQLLMSEKFIDEQRRAFRKANQTSGL